MTDSRRNDAPIQQRRILVRIWVAGVVLAALIWIVLVSVGRLVISPAVSASAAPIASWVVPRVAEARSDPARLRAELLHLRTAMKLEVSLYDGSGRLLGTSIEPPFPPLTPDELARLRELGELAPDDGPVATAVRQGGEVVAYGLVVRTPRGLWLRSSTWAFVGVLLVLAIGAIPLARTIVRPLERLASVTRAFGRGELGARIGDYQKDEIGDVARAFDEMADRVTFLLRAEKELLANVSHELKTPLARIRVALELASDGDPERARRYLREIAEDLGELERLVEDVLTAARLDLAEGRVGEGVPLHIEEVAAGALVARAAAKFEERHPGRKLVVRSTGALPSIDADVTLLRRAIDNLLENAKKYSDAPIELRAHAGEDHTVVVQVADRGIGIEAAELERVFLPFYRSDRSRARKTGGVGLGLALARRIVEAHGGEITLASDVGVGTTATIRIPARPAAESARAPQADAAQTPERGIQPAAPAPRAT